MDCTMENDEIIASHADYRREDFVFQRTQSIGMRDARWESRFPPLKRTPVRNAIAAIVEAIAR